jgi:hypothetical protein
MPSLLAGVDKVIDPVNQSSQHVLSEESIVARFRARGKGVVKLVGELPPDLTSALLHQITVTTITAPDRVDLARRLSRSRTQF